MRLIRWAPFAVAAAALLAETRDELNGVFQVLVPPPVHTSQARLAAMEIPALLAEALADAYSRWTPLPIQLRMFEILELDGTAESWQMLVETYLYGLHGVPHNGTLAMQWLQRLHDAEPSAYTHNLLGFVYGTGLFGQLPQDQTRANIHHTVAAELGLRQLAMVLAHRHALGIHADMNQGAALHYYGWLAREMAALDAQAPVGGPNLDEFAIRVGDLQGGVLGEGATLVHPSVGDDDLQHIKGGYSLQQVFESENIDVDDTVFALAYLKANQLYRGSKFVPRDYAAALKEAYKCAKKGLSLVGSSRAGDVVDYVEHVAIGRCAHLTGHMMMRGEGAPADYEKARHFLESAIGFGSLSLARVDLGLMYEHGLGVKPDAFIAEQHYAVAHKAKNYFGLYHYAWLMRKSVIAQVGWILGEVRTQIRTLLTSAANRQVPGAVYNLGVLYETGEVQALLPEQSMEEAVYMYRWYVQMHDLEVSLVKQAFDDLTRGQFVLALIRYGMAAEQGFESAEQLVAYLLHREPLLKERWGGAVAPTLLSASRSALEYYLRLGLQLNVDSSLVAGDMYFYGRHDADGVPDYDLAIKEYRYAGSHGHPLGFLNTGYMYEHGLTGVKDYYRAKRWYELALVVSGALYLPVKLSIWRLQLKSFWNRWRGSGPVLVDVEKLSRGTWSSWMTALSRARNGNGEDVLESTDRFHADQHDNDMEAAEAQAQAQAAANRAGNDPAVDPDDEVGFTDLAMFFAVAAFMMIMFVLNLRNRARGGNNGFQFEFNFMVVPI